MEVVEQYARKVFNSGKIKIGRIVCRERIWTTHTKCYMCLDCGHTSAICTDRGKARRICGQVGHQAKDCNESENCDLCKDHGAPTRSARRPVYRVELETRTQFHGISTYRVPLPLADLPKSVDNVF